MTKAFVEKISISTAKFHAPDLSRAEAQR